MTTKSALEIANELIAEAERMLEIAAYLRGKDSVRVTVHTKQER